MDNDLINIYVERLLKEIEELTKNRLLIETQLRYTESMNVAMSERIKQLEVQIEKQNTKNTKKLSASDTF